MDEPQGHKEGYERPGVVQMVNSVVDLLAFHRSPVRAIVTSKLRQALGGRSLGIYFHIHRRRWNVLHFQAKKTS